MPRIGYSEEHGSGSAKFPKIKLAAGERIRIVCPEQPWMAWAHTLRAPKIQNGQVLMKQSDRDGSLQPDLEWFGSPICTGDPEVLRGNPRHVDTQGCMVCQAVEQCEGVYTAQQRYAMNVVQYLLGAGGQLVGMQVVIWAYTSKMYDKLLDVKNEFAPEGDIRAVDLVLGPVEGPLHFQKYPIQAASKCLWKSDGNVFNQMMQVWTSPGNRATDEQLDAACGRRHQQESYLREDLAKVVNRWSQAQAIGLGQAGQQWAGQQPQQSLAGAFDGLAGQQPQQGFQAPHPLEVQAAQASQQNPFGGQPAPQQFQQAPAPQMPMTDPFGGQVAPQQAQQPAPAPALAQAVAPDMAAVHQQQAAQFAAAGWTGPGPQDPFGGPSAQTPQQPAPATAAAVPGAMPMTDPFGGPPQAQPPQPQAPPPSAAGFGAFPGAAAPQQAAPGSGFGEFSPQTTANPSPQAAAQAAANPSFEAPAPQPAPPQGDQMAFGSLFNETKQ